MRLFSNNELDMNVINEILKVYYLSTGISVFAINEIGNIIASSKDKEAFCKLFEDQTEDACPCSQAHLYASKQSESLGDSYIFSCPSGLIHFTVPIIYKGTFKGAIIAGPVLLNFTDELMVDSIMQKYSLPLDIKGKVKSSLNSISVVEPSRVHHLSKLLFYVISNFLDGEKELLYERQEKADQQSQINSTIQNLKNEGTDNLYPYESERELLSKIRSGDVVGAKAILNDIIGYIFFTSGVNIDSIKTRTTELCALLSRASVEAGADLNKIFGLNNSYMVELKELETIEDISYWMVKILDGFTESLFSLGDSKYTELIRTTVSYINKNYHKPITLDEVANLVHLNSSYFSSLFKKETGLSFSAYLNKVRIEESKTLLKNTRDSILDIALKAGFEDQSYFTKVFKTIAGLTPKEFRGKAV